MQNDQKTQTVFSRQRISLVVLAILPLLAIWIGCEKMEPIRSEISTVSRNPEPPTVIQNSTTDAASSDEVAGKDDMADKGKASKDDDANKDMAGKKMADKKMANPKVADDATSKSKDADNGSLQGVEFVDTDGNKVALANFIEKKNVLLVFTRGFSGSLCPFCTTQSSRLIANFDSFEERNTQILLVFPGSKDQISSFRQASLKLANETSFPFPVLLDEDLSVVNRLGIASDLASPSTFIIDRMGQVRYSYVGKYASDRPSIKTMLAQLDGLLGTKDSLSNRDTPGDADLPSMPPKKTMPPKNSSSTSDAG